ncbi:MAG: DUF885 domain-containing protein [Gemmatimonadaceae bacterium]
MTVNRRQFLRAGAGLAAGVAAAPLLQACKLESRRELADGGFAQLRTRHFREQLTLNPVTSTYLGGEGWDPALGVLHGRLRNHAPDALRDEADTYRDHTRAHLTIDDALLSPQGRVDHAVMGAQLAFLQHQLDRRYHERAVDTYVAEPFRGVDWQMQQMRATSSQQLGDEAEWSQVVERLSAVPEYLAIARANLEAGQKAGNMPDRRMVRIDGIAGSRANATYFRLTVPQLAKAYMAGQSFEGAMTRRLADAGAAAARAYEQFAVWMERTYPLNESANRFALGEAGYEWRVRTVLRDERSANELFDYGGRQVEEYTQRMSEVAERILRERGIGVPSGDEDRAWSIRRVMDDLSAESPANDEELLRWYREAAARAVAYGREREMFDVPADYRLDIVPTPPVLRSTIDAAYYPAPPLKNVGVGRFYLTPTGNDPAALRQHSRASVADTAVHEGFPGHDWHFKYMTQQAAEISHIRWLTIGAVEDSSSMWSDSMAVEGWGLYAEELMATPVADRPHGFYSPGEYLFELQGQLLRAARVRIDVGLHTGRMSFEDAVAYYTGHVSFFPDACAKAASDPAAKAACDSAARAIYRYSKWPTQAITYNLGKTAIVSMREAYRSRAGASYSPREFHEQFMRMGTIPPGFFRDVLLPK